MNPLARHRNSLKLTKKEFSMVSGIAYSTVAQVEYGFYPQIPKKLLKRICDFLKCDPNEFQDSYLTWRKSQTEELVASLR